MPLVTRDLARTDTEAPLRLRPAPRVRSWLARLRAHRFVLALGRLLPALIPALLFVPAVLAPPLNHDVAAVLNFSERWLGGEHLYSDLIDVNPPLIYVLNLVPAALERITPLSGVQSLQLCLIALGMVAWWLAVSVRDRAAEGPAERAFLDVLPMLFLFDGGYDFGQREHLMAVAALPYLLSAARRAGGARPRRRIAAAAFAAVGFALKPHFLAIPGLVELAVLGWNLRGGVAAGLRRSLRDPVPWTMAAVWAVYLISLPLVFSDYLDVVVPLVWNFYLDLGGLTALEVLLVPRMAVVLMLLAPLLCVVARRIGQPAARLPLMLALAALGAVASAVTQHKGWSYHIVPVELFTLGLGCVLGVRWLDAVMADGRATPDRRRATRVAAVFAALFGLYIASNGEAPWKELDYGHGEVAGLTALLKSEAAGERVLVLSPGIYPIFPALNYADAHLTLRTMNMWLLEGAYEECLPNGHRYREVWEMGRAEFFVFRTVAEDFARAPPAVVVVDKAPGIPWCGSEFDFIAYFSRHPLFAEVWSHYELTAEWDRYKVYARKD
jgi:hypothetical protein